MDSTDKLIRWNVAIVTAATVIICLGMTTCAIHQNEKAAQALEAGTSPVGVRCVFGGNTPTTCVLAQQEQH